MLRPDYERSPTAPRTWPDEYIEVWGEFFTRHPEIFGARVRFETFLYAPAVILRALDLPTETWLFEPEEVRRALGLPPADMGDMLASILARCDRARTLFEQGGARCSNGALVEKLRHNRIKRARHRLRNQDGRLL